MPQIGSQRKLHGVYRIALYIMNSNQKPAGMKQLLLKKANLMES